MTTLSFIKLAQALKEGNKFLVLTQRGYSLYKTRQEISAHYGEPHVAVKISEFVSAFYQVGQ